MKANLSRLGGQLGVGLCVAGFLLVFLGWNGAASNDLVVEQFPYLLSGGVSGLCLVVVGVGMIVVQNQRADRVALQATVESLRAALERSAPAATATSLGEATVVAGRSSYHRPDCRLTQGRDDADLLSPGEAEARGLAPCRVCRPGQVPRGPEPEPVGRTAATPEPATDEPATAEPVERPVDPTTPVPTDAGATEDADRTERTRGADAAPPVGNRRRRSSPVTR